MDHFDVILVGGGLANGLIADRLAVARRNLNVLIIEAADRLGGDHTWSYHSSDVKPEQDEWLRAIGRISWPSQSVHFPSYQRIISTGYRTIVSSDLHHRLTSHGHLAFSFATKVKTVEVNKVILESGRELHGACIIDGRGMQPVSGLKLGYQKFFGLECEMKEPHGLSAPILMDTTIEQIDGYRFMYCLPYSPSQMLIEDTYYSDGSELSKTDIERRVYAYARTKGWEIRSILRQESGVLPVVLDGSLEMIWPAEQTVPRSGMRAGLFHQTTGYSLAFAARAADNIVKLDNLSSQTVAAYMRSEAKKNWQKQSYFRLLNRLLFLAAEDDQRRNIFERFYCLSQPLIERFYAADLNTYDKFRILFGRPPVAVSKALAAIPPSAAAARIVGDLSSGE
ncbi:MAG: lycopene beta-cyclase CrtY [Pseudomonadota bacterium]